MRKVIDAMRGGAADFAGLIVFYALLWTVGLKAAIGGLLLFIVLDAIRRLRHRLGFPRLYVLSSALAVGFGAVDLLSDNPFMIKYEAVISSLAVGGMFLVGARGKSLIQEVAEQQGGENFDDRPEAARFFKFLTAAWGGYFVVKAAAYLWLGEMLPLDRLLEIRPVIGMVSLGLMMLLSWYGGAILERLSRSGLLPAPAQPAGKPVQAP